MVDLITNGHSTDKRGRPFPRRRNRPALIFAMVLAIIGGGVWIGVFSHQSADANAVACNAPSEQTVAPGSPPPPQLGEQVSPSSLASVTPAALSSSPVRVLNANGQSGQAAHVASELGNYGFAQASTDAVGNDPIYTAQDLDCQGQIRFGAAGEGAASSLRLVVPCAELIRDDRTDNTIDLALGSTFNDLNPNTDAQAVLKSLRVPAGTPVPPLDQALVKGATSGRC